MDTLALKRGSLRGDKLREKIFQTNLKRSTSALGSIKQRLENASSSSLARVEKEKRKKKKPRTSPASRFLSRYLSLCLCLSLRVHDSKLL